VLWIIIPLGEVANRALECREIAPVQSLSATKDPKRAFAGTFT